MIDLRGVPWLAGWLLGVTTLAGLALSWTSGDHFLAARLLNYLMPWLLLPLTAGVAFAIWGHRYGLGGFLALPTLAIVLTYAPLFWPVFHVRPPAPKAAAGRLLKVMSYNVWSRNQQVGEMARVIRAERPDILLLQEIGAERFTALRFELADLYPPGNDHGVHESVLLQGVLSRYPVRPLGAIGQLGQAQKATVLVPGEPVTVFNVHPLRRGGWQRRHQQIASLLEQEVLATPGPVILGGDFNTTDQTQLYRRLVRHLRNAHWEAGFGFGFTYPSTEVRVLGLTLPKLVRIDHIFYTDHLQVLSAGTVNDSGGSDHLPVTAIFNLNAK